MQPREGYFNLTVKDNGVDWELLISRANNSFYELKLIDSYSGVMIVDPFDASGKQIMIVASNYEEVKLNILKMLKTDNIGLQINNAKVYTISRIMDFSCALS